MNSLICRPRQEQKASGKVTRFGLVLLMVGSLLSGCMREAEYPSVIAVPMAGFKRLIEIFWTSDQTRPNEPLDRENALVPAEISIYRGSRLCFLLVENRTRDLTFTVSLQSVDVIEEGHIYDVDPFETGISNLRRTIPPQMKVWIHFYLDRPMDLEATAVTILLPNIVYTKDGYPQTTLFPSLRWQAAPIEPDEVVREDIEDRLKQYEDLLESERLFGGKGNPKTIAKVEKWRQVLQKIDAKK